MSETPFAPAPQRRPAGPRFERRSMGLKLLAVCGLALLMTIPALFVFFLIGDRTDRARQVVGEISALVGGRQTFLGPVVALPYTLPVAPVPAQPGQPGQPATVQSAVHVIYPLQAASTAATTSEVRNRSLFSVPVYRADIRMRSAFDLTGLPRDLPPGAVPDWSRAELVVGASDARGAQSDVVLSLPGRRVAAIPASTLTSLSINRSQSMNGVVSYPEGADESGLQFFAVPAPDVLRPDARFQAEAAMTFSGAQRIAFLPHGKTTNVSVTGDWDSPSFDGGFPAKTRRVAVEADGQGPALADGFSVAWTVPFIARGVPAEGGADTISRLGAGEMGVSFVEPANPYQSVSRALKYAPLFIGLVFLTFFIFEVTTSRRVHPAQYVLVGLAQVVFYLLLLALAEQVGFDLGFLLAAVATVGLLSAYASWAFDSRNQGLRALVVFTLLYAGIYTLMRLEELALLTGALASFAAIAAVMYFTRRIDWYGATAPTSAAKDV